MKTIAITSGKGGVGKTNVSVNLGLAFAEQGLRVLLLDADLGLANVDVVLGFQSQGTLEDVIRGGRDLEDVMVDVAPNLRILPAGSGILTLERLAPAELRDLASRLDGLGNSFDVLLIDTGAGLTENVLFFSAFADHVLVVTTPEPAAITDCYALIKVLASRCDDMDVHLLVNQVARPGDGQRTFERIREVVRHFLQVPIEDAGSLTKDEALADAVRERAPVLRAHPDAAITGDLRDLSSRLRRLLSRPKRPARDDFWTAWADGA